MARRFGVLPGYRIGEAGASKIPHSQAGALERAAIIAKLRDFALAAYALNRFLEGRSSPR